VLAIQLNGPHGNFKLLFYVAGSAAGLAAKNMKTFNEEVVLVSERLGRVTFSLVLTVQCLVFVVGVFILAASVSRSAFFLLVGVDLSRDIALALVVRADSQLALHAQSVAVEDLLGLTEHRSDNRQTSQNSPSDILSFTSLRLFSETKV